MMARGTAFPNSLRRFQSPKSTICYLWNLHVILSNFCFSSILFFFTELCLPRPLRLPHVGRVLRPPASRRLESAAAHPSSARPPAASTTSIGRLPRVGPLRSAPRVAALAPRLPTPRLTVIHRSPRHCSPPSFLVVAFDGLWDKVSNQEAIDVVSRSRDAAATSSVARSCAELVDMARRRGSRDDVTVMVVDLKRFVR
ncbi:putative protein phosphatase 2C 74 [Panicum miliaceum]|uniref:protein-serine/threonine phosphatase n=1 Tax=Panicum miliaceum TaxID=4540 RepID=A0A3L6R6W6_PANMI|nr:putative protein phosphatase 2C 74 [Panicum miliaceum]